MFREFRCQTAFFEWKNTTNHHVCRLCEKQTLYYFWIFANFYIEYFTNLQKIPLIFFLPRKPPTLFVKNQQIFILLTTAYNLSHRLFSYLRKTFFPPPVEYDSQTTLNHVIIIFSCEEELRIYFVDVNTTPIFHI